MTPTPELDEIVSVFTKAMSVSLDRNGDGPAPVDLDDEKGEGAFRLLVRTGREVAAIPDPPESLLLLGELVLRGGRTVVVGDTGHGKTTLCLQMLRAILRGESFLGFQGAGAGPVLIVDLEQGLRSIKRGLAETGLDDTDDVLHVSVPDGLALDREVDHYRALDDVLGERRPSVLLLDPYYKAHRADDPNAERPIIDLMRTLDALRTAYGFALVLPAHPRKEQPGREGTRKLTIHDVAGSGAATRGAEVVVAIERKGQGYARLRYLKDRDGDLPVGDAVDLVYTKEDGYVLDPKANKDDAEIERRVLEIERGWLTISEWAKEIGVRENKLRPIIEALAERGEVVFAPGSSVGRHKNARCFSTAPEAREQLGAPALNLFESTTAPNPVPTGQVGGSSYDEPLPSEREQSEQNPLL